MEIHRQASVQEWVAPWLQLPFYEEKCEEHEKQYNTVFCGQCKGQPICKRCWNHKCHEHPHHHPILKVLVASRRAAIDIMEISNFLDISDIQEYSINSKDIVFLNPHREGVPNPLHKPNCQVCKRRLISSDYRFCSIACKVNMSVGHDMPIVRDQEGSSQRRKSRKGIPQKAPVK